MAPKSRPPPLKGLADQPRYLILDAQSVSPPALSPRARDIEYASKRSGRSFALAPAQEAEKRVFTHVAADSDSCQDTRPPSVLSPEHGLPEDMQHMLRQLDDLASWVKAASSSRDCGALSIARADRLPGSPGTCPCGHGAKGLGNSLLFDKGKNRLPSGECDARQDPVDPSRATMSTVISPSNDCQSDGFIYIPDRNTPEFLAGSSSSPIAYPVCGYSSHPARHSPLSPDTVHDISYHRRFLERRSAPCPSPTSPLISPPSAKTSFRTLFQRSRSNTTAVARPDIPPGHVPVENALRQGKRIRLPWLRI